MHKVKTFESYLILLDFAPFLQVSQGRLKNRSTIKQDCHENHRKPYR